MYLSAPMDILSRSKNSFCIEKMSALERAFLAGARFFDGHAGFRGELLGGIQCNGRYVLLTTAARRLGVGNHDAALVHCFEARRSDAQCAAALARAACSPTARSPS